MTCISFSEQEKASPAQFSAQTEQKQHIHNLKNQLTIHIQMLQTDRLPTSQLFNI